MKVGVLKDIKVGEYRVIATPAEVSMLVGDGNEVYVQKGAGEVSSLSVPPVLSQQPPSAPASVPDSEG